MSIKAYKLIPIRDFEKSDLNRKEDKICGDVEKAKKEAEEKEVNEKDKPKRTIRDIVSDNLANTQFEPSRHYVADIKFPQKGAGDQMPIWLPNENQLPEFSKGFRIKKTHDEIDTILNNNEISDDLKIKLYTIFRKKYNNARKIGNYEDDEGADADDEDDDDREDVMRGRKRGWKVSLKTIRDIVDDLPASKQRHANRLVNIFMKNRKHLSWDMKGDIIRPFHRDIDVIENIKKIIGNIGI